ncbi:MAG: DUF971 domain-containing protein [Chthoniobacterales bacterium]
MTAQIKTLQIIGKELAIAWSDGHETFLLLKDVRKACPCAVCNGEPDVLGRGDKPEVKHTDASFELTSHEFVGGYGWQPKWADGHNTGIFSVGYLRRLDSSAP